MACIIAQLSPCKQFNTTFYLQPRHIFVMSRSFLSSFNFIYYFLNYYEVFSNSSAFANKLKYVAILVRQVFLTLRRTMLC